MLLILIVAYELDHLTWHTGSAGSDYLKRAGKVCLHQCLVVTENIWGFPLAGKLCRQLTMHASTTEAKFTSFCSWCQNRLCTATYWNHLLFKNGSENNVQFTFFCGDYFLRFFFLPLCYLLSRLSPNEPGRLRGYVTILVFFLNGYTCGTSGSKPDSLLTFLCSILCSHGNCCMFGRKLLKAVEKKKRERANLGREGA